MSAAVLSGMTLQRKACLVFLSLAWIVMCMGAGPMTEDEITAHYQRKLAKMTAILESGQCKHIYFDLGSNVGVQIRKLYQPRYFSRAKVLPIFGKYFGHGHRKDICAFGFEPNSIHTPTLERLEERYTAAGYPVVVFTHTAISNASGVMTFFRQPLADPTKHEYGSSLLRVHNNLIEEKAYVADFGQLLRDTVLKHQPQEINRYVVAKMDIEGAEFAVLPSLLNDRLICLFNVIMVEYHFNIGPRAFPKQFVGAVQKQAQCNTIMMNLDDETYNAGADGVPYPSNEV